jgi:phytoene dehydrogenase-like protein
MNYMTEYDFICVGGGPSGLTLVYCLGKLGYKCLLIDEHDSVGGCHRVSRVNGLFTEHAPRIYSSSYLSNAIERYEFKL